MKQGMIHFARSDDPKSRWSFSQSFLFSLFKLTFFFLTLAMDTLPLTSLALAEYYDANDPFAAFRQEFMIPTHGTLAKQPNAIESSKVDEECIYLCGNSLGLLPKCTKELILEELDAWGKRGVEGHWSHPYGRPWATMDEIVKEPLARIVGAKPVEVSVMNTLTTNLHLMLTAFYRPTETRYKILIEQKAFPSDHYAVVSHLQTRNIDPADGLVTLGPRPGEHLLRTEDVVDVIQKDPHIAVVLLSGVQYYTGQCFDMERITQAGHEAGCIVGWDLAHAVGNVPLKLHEWQVDFACWCSYKYLNAGAGAIGGLFIHEKYKDDDQKPRLAGWWGNEKENRFEMRPEFVPSRGASGYQLSNPDILSVTSLYGSLSVFDRAGGVEALRNKKSVALTQYLEQLLREVLKQEFEKEQVRILTPSNPKERGCQLSLEFPTEGKMMEIFTALYLRGVIVDERKPTVIRVAPTPLYNSFKDVYLFTNLLKQVMDEVYR
ncbi:pyridoxal phosphate-dependent transferase [Mycotypha africana]|uniref:pyridoxal phosphate-dependent transferase n=1 Tax=Mycotypha africana TaxID=64632 RepID=UPI0022FFCDC3|nr:pyridoxal phosphate-dependent transferase [Mycotypha africana]KAI8967130.1 pyridoxal phosphate-dependent transferase [Mycotypha africana]